MGVKRILQVSGDAWPMMAWPLSGCYGRMDRRTGNRAESVARLKQQSAPAQEVVSGHRPGAPRPSNAAQPTEIRRFPENAKRVAILQSSYIPWIGYFDLIASVDEFIFYDEVQYTKQTWRNRNRINTPQGAQWLTVPVTGNRRNAIRDMAIADPATGRKHWKVLAANYRRAPHFDSATPWLQPLYEAEWESLSELNQRLTRSICKALSIETKLTRSSDYSSAGDRNQRLVTLCKQAEAAVYLSGPRAADYLDPDAFAREGLQVEWMQYPDYPRYPQLWGRFEPNLSILDVLFNCGAEDTAAMLGRAA
jgi:hypothetical protein